MADRYAAPGFGQPKPKPKPKPNPLQPSPTKPKPYSPSTGKKSAFDILRDFFEDTLGLQFNGEIEGVIRKAMEDGFGPDQVDLIIPDLQETQAFKKRFPGWHKRISAGYNAISLGDYLALENQYHRIMQEAGLPAGFYDDPSDFGNWIANDVSPQEVLTRVQLATDAAQRLDPGMRQILGQFYGLGTGDLAAYFLDQSRALPVIERQFKASGIAAQALNSGLSVTNMERYEGLLDRGVTEQQAAQAYPTIAQYADTYGDIADRFGTSYSQQEAEEDVLFGQSQKRQQLLNFEQASFSGRSRGETGRAQRQSY